jgi:hypothetical protein
MRTLTADDETTIAASVAAEDLATGDYVTILSEVYELPSFFWTCDATILPPEEPVRIKFKSLRGGTPLKVKAICLPFVFVKTPKGDHETLDVRRQQLARLDRRYAETVYKALRP